MAAYFESVFIRYLDMNSLSFVVSTSSLISDVGLILQARLEASLYFDQVQSISLPGVL